MEDDDDDEVQLVEMPVENRVDDTAEPAVAAVYLSHDKFLEQAIFFLNGSSEVMSVRYTKPVAKGASLLLVMDGSVLESVVAAEFELDVPQVSADVLAVTSGRVRTSFLGVLMSVSPLEKVTSTKDAHLTFPKSTLELRVLTDDGSFVMTGLTVWNDDARKAQTYESRVVVAGLGVVPLDFNQRPGFQTSGGLVKFEVKTAQARELLAEHARNPVRRPTFALPPGVKLAKRG